MDPDVRARVAAETQIIMNSAASVSFHDPIKIALDINYFGAVRMLDLAHECTNLIALHHVSTVGTNCNQPDGSVIPEEFFPFAGGADWEGLVNRIVTMDQKQADIEEPKILAQYKYPSTYTLTKNLAEQYLTNYRRPDLCVVISRPAAISACDRQPFPGWTDSIGAFGGITYGLGRGSLVHDIQLPHVVSLITPCDYVVNAIMVSTAYVAQQPVTPDIPIFQVCGSGAFPKQTYTPLNEAKVKYLKYHPWENSLYENDNYTASHSAEEYDRVMAKKISWQQKRVKIAGMPYIGSEEHQFKEEQKLKALKKSYKVSRHTLGYFKMHSQIDTIDKLLGLIDHLDEEEAEIFNIDLRKVNNIEHVKLSLYGVGRYYCGLDLVSPLDDF